MAPGLVRLLLRVSTLAIVNVLAAALFLLGMGRGDSLNPWETDSKLEGNRLDESFDLAILGTSRAYTLSRYEANHRALESGLDANVLNLAMPAAGGVKPAWTYLRYCLDQGVRPKSLLVCLDPFVFFSEACNENHKFVYYEPFQVRFLRALMEDKYPWRRLLIYGRHKFTLEWLLHEPSPLPRFDNVLPALPDVAHQQARMESLYLEGVRNETFDRYLPYLIRILERCQKEGIAVHIALMPTLIGNEPGLEMFESALVSLRPKYPFTYHNFVNSLDDPSLFYDSDHLNAQGVERVVLTLLAPILSSKGAPVAFDERMYAKLNALGRMPNVCNPRP